MADVRLILGDCLAVLPTLEAGSINCCVTSPPYYGLRDYGHAGQIGLEPTPEEYVERLVTVFREVRRVLRDDGTLWLNLGDSYNGGGLGGGVSKGETLAGSSNRIRQGEDRKTLRAECCKAKDLIGIPWAVAFALRADGWWLRSEIIWHKPNPMPESVTDRPTKAHEQLFLLAKSERYWYDAEAVKEKAVGRTGGKPIKIHHDSAQGKHGATSALNDGWPGCETRNRRSVWTIATKPYKGAHFATFPPALVEPCILAGCPEGGTVLDPFSGAGTTGLVAAKHGRSCVGIELNAAYFRLARDRVAEARNATPLLTGR